MKALAWSGVLLMATMVVVAACSGAGAPPTASPIPTPMYVRPSPTTPAPTFSPTPVPTPNPKALAIRPCRGEDLVVQVGRGMGRTQHFDLSFGVTNVSGEACRMHGAAEVEMLDASGNVIGSGVTCAAMHPDVCPNLVTVIQPAHSPGEGGASFVISWPSPILLGRSCGGETTPLAIELPDGGGRIDLGDVGMPSCSIPSTSEFATPEPPTPTPDPTVGFR